MQNGKLTLKEIKEAFPEGAEIVERNLRDAKKRYNKIDKHIDAVLENDNYDETTKDFIVTFLQVDCFDDALKEMNRLQRVKDFYDGKANIETSIIESKQFPILDMFEPIGKVKKTNQGRRSFCCCPIHGEKTPSMCIYHDTNTFYCFGCHAGGDSITFIMKLKGLGFKEAVNYIGNLADEKK